MTAIVRILAAIAASAVSSAAWAYYGVDYNPDRPAPKTASTIVPLNYRVFRMTQPDGVVRLFVRDIENPDVLIPENGPWYGEVHSRQITVSTRDDFKGGRTGFLFVDGVLRMMLLGEREVEVPQYKPVTTNTLSALWPKRSEVRRMEIEARAAIWGDPNRWKFGFVNPNVAGALIACLAVAAAFLALSRRRWLMCVGIAATGILLFCLAKSQSRSGFLAFFAGCAPLVVSYFRARFSWGKVAVCALVLAGALGFGWYSMAGRIDVQQAGLLNQADDTSRLPIWRAVPRMCVTAPGGWGRNFTGKAYNNWFQPPEREHKLNGLLSSHFIRLAELGWAGRFCYLFGWIGLLGLLWAAVFRGRSPLPASVWMAFSVAAIFNHVTGFTVLWVVPVLSLVPFAAAKPWREWRVCVGVCMMMAAVAGLLLSAIGWIGVQDDYSAEGPRIAREGCATIVGNGAPSHWLVCDEYVLDGGYRGFFGKEVRLYYKRRPNAPAIGFVDSINDLPGAVDTLVLAGKSAGKFVERWRTAPNSLPKVNRLVLLSPPFAWSRLPKEFLAAFKTELATGDFAAQMVPDYETAPDWVKLAPGAELYVPGWLDYVLNGMGK